MAVVVQLLQGLGCKFDRLVSAKAALDGFNQMQGYEVSGLKCGADAHSSGKMDAAIPGWDGCPLAP